MARAGKRKTTAGKDSALAKRGRKPIFTPEQKRVLERHMRQSLRELFRGLIKKL